MVQFRKNFKHTFHLEFGIDISPLNFVEEVRQLGHISWKVMIFQSINVYVAIIVYKKSLKNDLVENSFVTGQPIREHNNN
jgi:hypothetical protein